MNNFVCRFVCLFQCVCLAIVHSTSRAVFYNLHILRVVYVFSSCSCVCVRADNFSHSHNWITCMAELLCYQHYSKMFAHFASHWKTSYQINKWNFTFGCIRFNPLLMGVTLHIFDLIFDQFGVTNIHCCRRNDERGRLVYFDKAQFSNPFTQIQ